MGEGARLLATLLAAKCRRPRRLGRDTEVFSRAPCHARWVTLGSQTCKMSVFVVTVAKYRNTYKGGN